MFCSSLSDNFIMLNRNILYLIISYYIIIFKFSKHRFRNISENYYNIFHKKKNTSKKNIQNRVVNISNISRTYGRYLHFNHFSSTQISLSRSGIEGFLYLKVNERRKEEECQKTGMSIKRNVKKDRRKGRRI